MKKIRRILSFVIAMAMIMSMSTLCFLVTAEGGEEEIVAHGAGTTYTLDLDVANGEYSDGVFTLSDGPVNAPEAVEEGQTLYAAPTSGDYSVDVFPTLNGAFIAFKAPVDGVYKINAMLEKLAVEDENAVINFSSCVFYFKEGVDSGNTGWKFLKAVGETANHTKTFKMEAGDVLVLQVGAEEGSWVDEAERNTTTGNDKAIALKDFTVTCVYTFEVGNTYTLDIDIATDGYTDGLFQLGSGAADTPNTNGAGIYTDAASDEYSVDIVSDAKVYFTAPVDGVYSVNVDLEKLAVEDENAVINFASCVFYFKEGINSGNTGWKSLKAVGATSNHTKTFTMKAGETLTLEVGAEEGDWIAEAERNTTTGNDKAIALKDFSVTHIASTESGTKYSLDIDTSTDGYTDGMFMLGTGNVYNPNTNGAGIYTDAASDEYSVDIVGDAQVYFTAPVDGEYTFNVDLEKLAVNDGGAVSHFASIVFHISGDAVKANTGWGPINGAGTTANHSKTWVMQAGDMIVLQVGPESDNTTVGTDRAIALKDFTVTYNGEHVCSEWNKDGTCVDKATCVLCGEATGEFDRDNHTAAPTGYTDNGDVTHTVHYTDCCGVDVIEVHDFTISDTCANCEAALNPNNEQYVVYFDPNGNKTVSRTSNIDVAIKLDGIATEYASGKMVITYDPTVLDFNTIDYARSDIDENDAYVDNTVDGVIVIVVAGKTTALADIQDTIVTLKFTANKNTDENGTKVVLESAAFSDKVTAETADLIPAVKYNSTHTIVVTAQVFDVTLDDSLLDGATEATELLDYTFGPTDVNGEYYDYTVSATVNGEAVEISGDRNGPWTIAGADVTGDIEITVSRVVHTYAYSFENNADGSDASGWITDTAGAPNYESTWSFTVTNDTFNPVTGGNYYVVEDILVGGNSVKASCEYNEETRTWTIPVGQITGDIVVKVSETFDEATGLKVTFTGNAAGAASGELVAPFNTEYTFTLTKVPGYSYVVSYTVGETEYTFTAEEAFVIPAELIVAENGEIVITVTSTVVVDIEVREYLTLDNGYTMYLVLNEVGKLENVNFVMNDGVADATMFWSEKYSAYCYLVVSNTGAPDAAEYTYTIVAAESVNTVDYGMDVNNSGVVDANDAQLVYNMYMTEYEGFTANVTVMKYLRADVNGDMTVNVQDASAIVNYCLTH